MSFPSREVVPLGGMHAKIVLGAVTAGLPWRGLGMEGEPIAPEPAHCGREHLGKLAVDIEPLVVGEDVEDITRVSRGAVDKDPGFLAFELDLEATARIAPEVPHVEFSPLDDAIREDPAEEGQELGQEAGLDLVPLGAEIDRLPIKWVRGVVEIEPHGVSCRGLLMRITQPGNSTRAHQFFTISLVAT